MRIQNGGLGRAVLVGTAALAFCCWQTSAQSKAAQSGGEQTRRVPARVTDTVDDTNRTVLRGNVHPMARAEFDSGAMADAQPVTRILLLLQRSAEQEAALRQLMEEQQSRNSPNYHAWLTPEDFGKRFGPADADVQAVTDWLTSHGFQNIKVTNGKTVVEFSGNVGQVRNAFATEIRKFNVNGEEHFANVSDPQIPAALAPVLRGVVSLHNFRPKPMMRSLGTFQRNAQTGEVRPAFTFTDVNGTFYAMGPADFAKIYNIPSGATGAGQSIAIVGQSNINLQDVTDFRAIFGLPAYSAGQLNVILNGPDPGLAGGDEGESDLDVEWAGAVAPAATIDFVVTETTQTDATSGVDGSAIYIVDNNIAPILSESYGACESSLGTAGNAFINGLWQQAAAQGITVVVSAGDDGSAGCDDPSTPASGGLAVSGTASTPYNVAMGGTDFDDANNQATFWNTANSSTTPPVASAKGYIPETTWNDSCAAAGISGCAGLASTATSVNSVAGSGGPSSVYTGALKPSWQTGLGDTARDIPDVSLFSSDGQNKSFYIVCQSDQDITGDTGCNLTKFVSTSPFHDFQAVGGTSAATPTFAAIIALVNQHLATAGNPTPRQGNVNYALYGLAKTAANVCTSAATPPSGCVFNDVVKGNISVACVAGSPNCSNTSTAANQFGAIATTKGGTTVAFSTATGYDLATGLGSVNVANLLTKFVAPVLTGTITTLSGPPTSTIGASVTFTGTVTKSSGTTTPTGLVLLEDQSTGVTIASVPLPATGAFSITTTLLPAAATPYNLIAHYGGDGTFAASDSTPLSMTVPKQNSQVLVSFVNAAGALTTAAQNISYGSDYILRVDVTNTAGTPCQNANSAITFVCPTGSIQLFQSPGTALNDFPNAQNPNATNVARLNDRGFAEDQPIQLATGSYSISATYTADANSSFNSSTTSNTLSVTVTKATTTAAVTASPVSVASGGSVTLTATISSTSNSSVGPGGTVQFMNGSTALGGAVTCTSAGAAGATGASCKATLSSALSHFMPMGEPRVRPNVPLLPLGVIASLLMVFLAMQRRLSLGRRMGYAAAGLLLYACLAAGFAGCGGSKNSSPTGGGSHTDSITAVYSGDVNYSGSTSSAATVTVQ
jgi:Pro-kumamolisin, activation domain/Bacterial Ig-like domain (group 3)